MGLAIRALTSKTPPQDSLASQPAKSLRGSQACMGMTGPGPHTAGGFLQSTATGVGVGTVTGGAGGAASHGLSTVGGRLLSHTPPAPSAPGARLLDDAVARSDEVRLASDSTDLANAGSAFMDEIHHLQKPSYHFQGDRMMP